jgi:hypothetical protein
MGLETVRLATACSVVATAAFFVGCSDDPSTGDESGDDAGVGAGASAGNTMGGNTSGGSSPGGSSSGGGTSGGSTSGGGAGALGGGGSGGTANGGRAGSGGITGDPEGPRFLAFSTNVETLLEGESLVLSAILTDPDGIDDLIGGTLVDPATRRSYGSFATSAAEGSYSLTLSWQQINTLASITTGGPGTTVERSFAAEFFDVAGNSAEQVLTVQLGCGDDATCCSGTGADLTVDAEHCGSCERACPSDGTCNQGGCEWGERTTVRQSCNATCAANGGVCEPGVDHEVSGTCGTIEVECDDVPLENDPESCGFNAVVCLCVDA